MKKLILSLCLVAAGLTVYAQQFIEFPVGTTDIDGTNITIQEFLDNNTTVMLDFHFIACGPCNTWAPEIVNMYNNYQTAGANFEVIEISTDPTDDSTALQNHMASFGMTWRSIDGVQGSVIANDWSAQYPFTGTPTYVVIAPNGTVTWDVWPVTSGVPELISVIDPLLQSPPPPTSIEDISTIANTTVYPNPASNIVTFEFTLMHSKEVTIELLNILGQKLMSINEYCVVGTHSIQQEVSMLPDGNYFAKISDQENSVMLKFKVIR